MRLTEGYVFLKDAVFYAFHGVMPQEQQVGGCYKVSLRVGYPLAQAMAQPSRLLEHVAKRIADAVSETFPKATSIDLTLTKQNPPMGADCDGAGVELHLIKE